MLTLQLKKLKFFVISEQELLIITSSWERGWDEWCEFIIDNSSLHSSLLRFKHLLLRVNLRFAIAPDADFIFMSAYGRNMPCFKTWLVKDCDSCRPNRMVSVTLGKFCFSRYVFFIFSPSVRSPTTMLSYQTSLEVETFLLLRSHKNSFKGFRWLRYSSKETTGQFGLGFSYIKPQSKPSSSSRRFFVNSSAALHTQRAPVLPMLNERSVLLTGRILCLPRRRKNSTTSKTTLFWSLTE